MLKGVSNGVARTEYLITIINTGWTIPMNGYEMNAIKINVGVYACTGQEWHNNMHIMASVYTSLR